MKLHSLKQSFEQWNEPKEPDSDEYYPSLYLDEHALEDMDLGNVRVGTEMTMVSTVRVSTVNESKRGQRSMSFEILEAALKPKEDGPDASTVLFPND